MTLLCHSLPTSFVVALLFLYFLRVSSFLVRSAFLLISISYECLFFLLLLIVASISLFFKEQIFLAFVPLCLLVVRELGMEQGNFRHLLNREQNEAEVGQ